MNDTKIPLKRRYRIAMTQDGPAHGALKRDQPMRQTHAPMKNDGHRKL